MEEAGGRARDLTAPLAAHPAQVVKGPSRHEWSPRLRPGRDEVPQHLLQHAGADHWVSVSRGPPTDAIDALGNFKRTFRQPEPQADVMEEHLMRPEAPFEPKRIEDLVPVEILGEYLRLSVTVP